MGRIKSKLVKKSAEDFISASPELFTKSFEENKKILGNTMPSKKIRNQIAGYIARIKKREFKLIEHGSTN
ncbi:MAG: 30S ribosomal protein S17e [Candidatus Pacearchaeota archaeon]